jgi:GAF domain-containing protein
MAFPEEALGVLTELSEVALAFEHVNDAQAEICRIAERAIQGAEGASLTSISERGPGAVAASNEWAKSLDEVQFAEHEGPCLDAARSGFIFRVRDTKEDGRWPSYMPRAVEIGARSMVSLPLTTETKVTGALNVYSRSVDAFDAEHVSVAELIAGHASLASRVAASLHQHKELTAQLREAITSRALIEQAKGVIMTTTRCDAEAAFKILVEQSQSENRKVREIAEEIVARQSR